jgi:methionyl-tRNA formyltransferase
LRTPDDGLIDWSASNIHIYNLVRALVRPWPGAFTYLRGRKVTVWRVEPVEALAGEASLGVIHSVDHRGIRIATGDGDILIHEFEMNGTAVGLAGIEGMGISVGHVLGN